MPAQGDRRINQLNRSMTTLSHLCISFNYLVIYEMCSCKFDDFPPA